MHCYPGLNAESLPETEPLLERGVLRARTSRLSHCVNVKEVQLGPPEVQLGPPISRLTDNVSAEELQVFRERYQAFRAGKARGAKGEVAGIPSLSSQAMMSRIHEPGRCMDEDYENTQEVLGDGFEGQVRLVKRRDSHRKERRFAVKSLKLEGESEHHRIALEEEVRVFFSMDHPHVARLVDVYAQPWGMQLVMECLEGGTLRERMNFHRLFSNRVAAQLVRQMLLALSYVHSLGVAHRDVKPENFMFDRRRGDHLKLIDFGFSRFVQSTELQDKFIGSLPYCAPEQLHGDVSVKADMWSVGVLTFELLSGQRPFKSSKKEVMKGMIASGQYKFALDPGAPCKDFVGGLILVDPERRLSALSALQHVWIQMHVSSSWIPYKAHGPQLRPETLDVLRRFSDIPTECRQSLSVAVWSMADDELAMARDAFLIMDSDHDGEISLAELKDVLVGKLGASEEEACRIFFVLDANGQRKVTYSEFLAGMLLAKPALQEELLPVAFNKVPATAEQKWFVTNNLSSSTSTQSVVRTAHWVWRFLCASKAGRVQEPLISKPCSGVCHVRTT